MNISTPWNDEHTLLNTDEAAHFLKKRKGTLQNWRSQNSGPSYIKCGASVRYRMIDLLDFIERNRVELG